MNVSFIGSGNLSWHLAPALDNTGYPVREVYSLNPRNAEALVKKLYHAQVHPSLDFSSSVSKIFVIAATDDVIPDIASEIILPDNAIVVHTSGSQPLEALSGTRTSHTGVFYPLQTFTKQRKVDLSETPIFIESADSAVESVIMKMGKAISKKVYKISSGERSALHVAAVFASNFTNHMITLSRDIAESNKLSFDWLKPLIIETVNKSLALGPNASQTGPARRGDLETLDRHMDFLIDDTAVAEIYRVISQHIVDHYSE